jgi:hypothetical protein
MSRSPDAGKASGSYVSKDIFRSVRVAIYRKAIEAQMDAPTSSAEQ